MKWVYLKQKIDGNDFYYELNDMGWFKVINVSEKSISNYGPITLHEGFEIIEEAEYDLVKKQLGF